mgnify:FL=1
MTLWFYFTAFTDLGAIEAHQRGKFVYEKLVEPQRVVTTIPLTFVTTWLTT